MRIVLHPQLHSLLPKRNNLSKNFFIAASFFLLSTALHAGRPGIADRFSSNHAPLFLATLKGTVTSDGRPVSGASVIARPSGKGAVTDASGNYSLSLKAGSYSLSISFVGFVSQTIDVQLADGDQKTVDIALVAGGESLETVAVVGNPCRYTLIRHYRVAHR